MDSVDVWPDPTAEVHAEIQQFEPMLTGPTWVHDKPVPPVGAVTVLV
jgi:hypothetical protein